MEREGMDIIASDEKVFFIKNTRAVRIFLVLILILLGFGIRMVDLNDPPLDFAATRQLHSLVLARGYYYSLDIPATRSLPAAQREIGIQAAENEVMVEPPILEWVTAFIYALLGQENFQIPRILTSVFWVLGGIPLYLLMRRITTTNGAVFTLAFYELLPFGVFASRSFQPDPVMVSLILFALFFQYNWMREPTYKNALLAAFVTGLAVIIKAPAVFFAGIPFIGFVLLDGFKPALRNRQVYLMAAISIIPTAAYFLYSATLGNNAPSLFNSRFFPSLFGQPKWYLGWFMMARSVVGYIPLFLAVLAFFLLTRREHQVLYSCLWLGYALQGISFAYHITTHDYYHLPLVPIVAMGCGMFFSICMEKFQSMPLKRTAQVVIILILLLAPALAMLVTRSDLLSKNYRYEEKYWRQLGEQIGTDTQLVALTHDYGLRLTYWGSVIPRLWATRGDLTVEQLRDPAEQSFQARFDQAVKDSDYFLVTLLDDFKSQKELYATLFSRYPYSQGEGYYLFDLQNPL